jgi:hypothetical protein
VVAILVSVWLTESRLRSWRLKRIQRNELALYQGRKLILWSIVSLRLMAVQPNVYCCTEWNACMQCVVFGGHAWCKGTIVSTQKRIKRVN